MLTSYISHPPLPPMPYWSLDLTHLGEISDEHPSIDYHKQGKVGVGYASYSASSVFQLQADHYQKLASDTAGQFRFSKRRDLL